MAYIILLLIVTLMFKIFTDNRKLKEELDHQKEAYETMRKAYYLLRDNQTEEIKL